MVSETQLNESLTALLKTPSLSATAEEIQKYFLSLARIAPNCMTDPDTAFGFIAVVLK